MTTNKFTFNKKLLIDRIWKNGKTIENEESLTSTAMSQSSPYDQTIKNVNNIDEFFSTFDENIRLTYQPVQVQPRKKLSRNLKP